MTLRTLILPDEFTPDPSWMEKIRRDSKEVEFLTITEFESQKASGEQALLLAHTEEQVQWARTWKLAVVGVTKQGETMSGVDTVIWGLDEVDFDYLNKQYERYHGLPWHILDTRRCSLREQTVEDLDVLYEIYEGEGMTQYMEPLYQDRQREKSYLEDYIRIMYGFYQIGLWMVIDKETGKCIGRAGVFPTDVSEGNQLEMGYMIAREYQHKGIASEVCEAILQYAKQVMPGASVNCLIHRDNAQSIALATHLGMKWIQTVERDGKKLERYCI